MNFSFLIYQTLKTTFSPLRPDQLILMHSESSSPTWLPLRQHLLINATLNHCSIPQTLLGFSMPKCARVQGSDSSDIYPAALEAEAAATKQTSLPIIVTLPEPSENEQRNSRSPILPLKCPQKPTDQPPALSAQQHLESMSYQHICNWKSERSGERNHRKTSSSHYLFLMGNWLWERGFTGEWWSSPELVSQSSRASCLVLLWCLHAEFGLARVSALDGLFIFSGAGRSAMRFVSHSICLRITKRNEAEAEFSSVGVWHDLLSSRDWSIHFESQPIPQISSVFLCTKANVLQPSWIFFLKANFNCIWLCQAVLSESV